MAKCLVLVSLALTSVFAGTTKNPVGRIVGGSDAPDGAYPYQVSVRNKGSHNCGGSIIHHEWIITAAHCIKGYSLEHLTIVVGSNQLNIGGTTLEILEAHIHEDYDDMRIKNDVGLFRVKPMEFSERVRPIVLDAEEIGGDQPCIVSGWGLLGNPGEIPNNLQHLRLNTTSVEFCRSSHGSFYDGESELCTFTKVGEGVCSADSGGPLVRKVDGVLKQIGVVSYGRPCAVGTPDVYARMSVYLDWFQKTCNNCF